MEKISIENARPEDLEGMLDLIKELAEYEKAPDAVIVDLPQFRQYFEEGLFRALVARVNGKVAGMALYYYAYSSWKGKILYLDDLVITRKERRKGLGKLLFDELIRISERTGCRQMRWHVLDWNEPAIRFYEKYGASLDPEWITGKFEWEQLKALAEKLNKEE